MYFCNAKTDLCIVKYVVVKGTPTCYIVPIVNKRNYNTLYTMRSNQTP